MQKMRTLKEKKATLKNLNFLQLFF